MGTPAPGPPPRTAPAPPRPAPCAPGARRGRRTRPRAQLGADRSRHPEADEAPMQPTGQHHPDFLANTLARKSGSGQLPPDRTTPMGERGILGEGCRDCYRPVRRRSQSSTVARVDASAVPRRRCSRRCAMDRRYSGMANDGRSRPPPATRMWWANPRSRVVIGTTMTSPTGQALNALVETTRTGRVPLCSPGPAGSRDASQTSPRSGIQTLDRCFLPLATLGEVVAPCLGVHLAQLAHLSGGLLHQCRVLYLARPLIEQCMHRFVIHGAEYGINYVG